MATARPVSRTWGRSSYDRARIDDVPGRAATGRGVVEPRDMLDSAGSWWRQAAADGAPPRTESDRSTKPTTGDPAVAAVVAVDAAVVVAAAVDG